MPPDNKGSRYAFQKTNRLRKTKEFLSVQEKAAKVYCKHFLLLISKAQTKSSRLGITVTKKVDKRAVARNRIKRRVREIFRNNKHLFRENFDIIIIARKNAADIKHQDTVREILEALENKGYLKAEN